jgi:hypothetical protein
MTPEQQQEVQRLRALNLSPKQIARQLGLRPSEVTTLIQAQATAIMQDRLARGELAPIYQCLIDTLAAQALLDPKSKRSRRAEEGGTAGLSQVFVCRRDDKQYLLSSFLVDYWCLGVKDAFGPRKIDEIKYNRTIEEHFRKFGHGFREISLEEAQSVVLGVIEYADSLGFKPHADYEKAKTILGNPTPPLMPIEFGKEGKPMYINGPYDNPDRIIATLEKTVGKGNFHFALGGPF